MRASFRSLARRVQTALMLAAGYLPAPLLLCARLTPDQPWRGLYAPLLYVCAAAACAVVPGRRRLLAGALGAAAIAALGLAALPWRAAPALLAIPVLYGYLLLAGLSGDGLPIAIPCAALALHAAAQVVQWIDARSGGGMPASVVAALRCAFVLYGFLALISMNRASLRDAAAKGSPAPLSMQRKNLLLALGMGAVTLLIACLPAVARLFQRLWNAFLAALGRALLWLGSLFAFEEAAESGGGGAPAGGMGALAAAEPHPFWQIVEKAAIALGVVAAAAAAALLLRLLWKNLRRLLAALRERLRQFARAASEDYRDEISDTREGGERMRLFRRRARRPNPLRGIDAAKLPPRQRVRFFYLRARLKRPDWEDAQTVREQLPADAAEIYERARYSQREVSEGDAGSFEDRLR